MKVFKTILAAGLFIFAVASPVMALATPQTAGAVTNCEARILGIPPWYRGLTENNAPKCDMSAPDPNNLGAYIWKIVLNVVEMALVIIAYIAVFFILYSGFLYITGGSNPSQLEKAKKSITNAVIGLVISMAAVAIINLVFGIIT